MANIAENGDIILGNPAGRYDYAAQLMVGKADIHVDVVDTDGDGIPDSADTDDDNDGISDIDEIHYGLNPLDPSDANEDADHDGISNIDEINAGTDPRGEEQNTDITITSVTPLTATQGEYQNYTIVGTNLPKTIVGNIEGSVGHCTYVSGGGKSIVISCRADVVGNKQRFYLKEKSGGTAISGSEAITIVVAKQDVGVVSSFVSNPSVPRKFQSITLTATTSITRSSVRFKFGGGAWHRASSSNGGKTWRYTRSVGIKGNVTCYVDIDSDGVADKTLALNVSNPKFNISSSSSVVKVGENIQFAVATDVLDSSYKVQVKFSGNWFDMVSSDQKIWTYTRQFESAGTKIVEFRIIDSYGIQYSKNRTVTIVEETLPILTFNKEVNSSVEKGKFNYYKIKAKAGEHIHVVLSHLSVNLDLYIQDVKKPVLSDFTAGPHTGSGEQPTISSGSTWEGTHDEVLDFIADKDKDVFVGVYGKEAGSYSLKIVKHSDYVEVLDIT